MFLLESIEFWERLTESVLFFIQDQVAVCRQRQLNKDSLDISRHVL